MAKCKLLQLVKFALLTFMKDPCGFMYDPIRDEYHGFYQWHPEHINWGNISWGHAVSNDLITWTDVTGWEGYDALALGPTDNNETYAGLGIFSGTAVCPKKALLHFA